MINTVTAVFVGGGFSQGHAQGERGLRRIRSAAGFISIRSASQSAPSSRKCSAQHRPANIAQRTNAWPPDFDALFLGALASKASTVDWSRRLLLHNNPSVAASIAPAKKDPTTLTKAHPAARCLELRNPSPRHPRDPIQRKPHELRWWAASEGWPFPRRNSCQIFQVARMCKLSSHILNKGFATSCSLLKCWRRSCFSIALD